jgi:hypothetical protein
MIIVPRGETKEFYEFMAVTAHANGDSLVVDRRVQENRRADSYGAAPEKRRVERRHPAPSSWTHDDVIVVKSN